MAATGPGVKTRTKPEWAGCGPARGRGSRLGARAARHGLMPAAQIGELRRDRDVSHAPGDVDCDQRSDVGDREPVAGDELAPGQLAVHPLQSLLHDGALRLAVIGKLPQPLL